MKNTPKRRPISLEDLARIALVSDPHSSPDGETIAYVVTRIDDEDDGYTSAIWLTDADGSNPRQLTAGTSRDQSPTWSPDGQSIAFTSNRTAMLDLPKPAQKDDNDAAKRKKKNDNTASECKLTQVWVIRLDGGEAMQVTNHAHGASSPTWAPDSARIAFVASDDVADDEKFAAPMTNGQIADERVIRDLRYRFDGRGYIERYSHIWTVAIDSADHTQITFGDVHDQSPTWNPVSDDIAFVSNRRDDRKRNLSPSAIHVVSASGGDVRTMTDIDGSFGTPCWSPDGTQLAFSGHLNAANNTALDLLWLMNADGSDARPITEGWDTPIGDMNMSDVHASSEGIPLWMPDGTLAFLASQRGSTHIFVAHPESHEVTPITSGKRRISGFALTKHGLAYVCGTITRPSELFVARSDGRDESQATHLNDDLFAELDIPDVLDLDVTAPDGWEIQGWLIPPVKVDGKHPLIVEIHGGPHAMYGYDFFHEMHLLAAKGYGVAFCNPRGSAGYGHTFVSCTRAKWGESDMPDVMATLDAAIDAADWVDTQRLGVTGGSYGGYLTNWIIGHSNRFSAAVTQRCVSNFHSFFGTSDIGVHFGEFEFGGVPWKNASKLLKYSPFSYVEAMTTPLLIVHSEQDLRCPIEQSEQLFTALKYLERDVEMVRFPEESHDLSRSGRPSRRRARLSHILRWFDTHLESAS